MDRLFLGCLSLAEQVIDAARAQRWNDMVSLQAMWQQQIQQYMAQASKSDDLASTEAQLARLLEDVSSKTAELERIIARLQARQQHELKQLKQAQSYLSGA